MSRRADVIQGSRGLGRDEQVRKPSTPQSSDSPVGQETESSDWRPRGRETTASTRRVPFRTI